jgi:hypothetical protein
LGDHFASIVGCPVGAGNNIGTQGLKIGLGIA